jgi:hypothetical protein
MEPFYSATYTSVVFEAMTAAMAVGRLGRIRTFFRPHLYLSSDNETTPGTGLSPCVADTYALGAPQWHFGPAAGYNAFQIVDRPSVKPWRR